MSQANHKDEAKAHDPLATPDDPRCNTQALDLGAVRAIYRAGNEPAPTSTATPAAATEAPAPATEAPVASDTSHDTLIDPAAGLLAAIDAAREVPSAREGVPTEEPATDPATASPWHRERSEVAIDRAALPSSQLAKVADDLDPPRTTVEVDYSPSSRNRRTRNIRVQRFARGVLAVAGVASIAVGLWAWMRHRGAPPPSAYQASTLSSAVVATVTPPSEPPSIPTVVSTDIPAPERSTIPTGPVPGAVTGTSAGPGKGARAPATSTVVAPVDPPPDTTAVTTARPSATVAPPPGGTVDVPILE